MMSDEPTYDEDAEDYESIVVRLRSGRATADLVALLSPALETRILDVGTGTGTVLRQMAKVEPRRGLLVGADPAIGMLRVAKRKGLRDLVVGGLPRLPFRAASFGAVFANFVLSHTASPTAALEEIRRVLVGGGRVAVSCWNTVENDYKTTWGEVLAEATDLDELWRRSSAFVPSEESFLGEAHLEAALETAGFEVVRSETHAYDVSESARDFVAARGMLLSSRLLAHDLGPMAWDRLCQTALERLKARFLEPFKYTIQVSMVCARTQAE